MATGNYQKTPEHIAKIQANLINFKKGFDERRFGKGAKHSEETKKRFLVTNKMNGPKTPRGELSPHWKGGISYLPYSPNWTNELREMVRIRDSHKCRLCEAPQKNRLLDIHHIDYDKKNCEISNLVSLCRSCHIKTNTSRNEWVRYFTIKKHVFCSE